MDVSYIILLFGIITIVFIIYYNIGNNDMTYIRSDLDNTLYMVRNNKDKHNAANLLAQLKANIYSLTKYMNDKLENIAYVDDKRYISNRPYILQLKERIQNVIIKESASNSIYTSYTINKGEQIILCIRSKSMEQAYSNNIHDINLIKYVVLHEISHVACPEYNHTPLFNSIFRFICEEAIEMGIYNKVDYRANPMDYCGMTISDSVI